MYYVREFPYIDSGELSTFLLYITYIKYIVFFSTISLRSPQPNTLHFISISNCWNVLYVYNNTTHQEAGRKQSRGSGSRVCAMIVRTPPYWKIWIHSFCVIVCDKLSYRVLLSSFADIAISLFSFVYMKFLYVFYTYYSCGWGLLHFWFPWIHLNIQLNFTKSLRRMSSVCLLPERAYLFVDRNHLTIHSVVVRNRGIWESPL